MFKIVLNSINSHYQQFISDYLLKVLLIGNSGVGKSCILMRYAENQFTNYFYNTIGVDFVIKFDLTYIIRRQRTSTQEVSLLNYKLQKRKYSQIYNMQWDTAGQDRFRTITSSYYRGAHGIMIVYDITDRESFENVKNWISEIEKFAQQDVNKILIGNKVDINDMRKVSTIEGQNLAQQYKFDFFEASAKNDINIEQSFICLTEKIVKRIGPQQNNKLGMRLQSNQQKPDENKQNKDAGCCSS